MRVHTRKSDVSFFFHMFDLRVNRTESDGGEFPHAKEK